MYSNVKSTGLPLGLLKYTDVRSGSVILFTDLLMLLGVVVHCI